MSATITRTKIILPRRRKDLVSRARLLGLLEDLLDYPLTLISAPAGYGKTSLLIDAASQAEYPVCWYSLDALDQDPQRFLGHLVGSIQQQFPDFGKKTAPLLIIYLFRLSSRSSWLAPWYPICTKMSRNIFPYFWMISIWLRIILKFLPSSASCPRSWMTTPIW